MPLHKARRQHSETSSADMPTRFPGRGLQDGIEEKVYREQFKKRSFGSQHP